jgi:hypothetical protein
MTDGDTLLKIFHNKKEANLPTCLFHTNKFLFTAKHLNFGKKPLFY